MKLDAPSPLILDARRGPVILATPPPELPPLKDGVPQRGAMPTPNGCNATAGRPSDVYAWAKAFSGIDRRANKGDGSNRGGSLIIALN